MSRRAGFEEDKYEISLKCGECALMPAVRKAGLSTLVIADGFSCKEQIQQDTPRHALDLAELMQMALHDRDGAHHMYPEKELVRKRTDVQRRSMKWAGIATILILAGGAMLSWYIRRPARY